jgi:hypothetical protein
MKKETETMLSDALVALLEARRGLADATAALDTEALQSAPGSAVERTALGMTRTMGHISEAIADVPEGAWATLFDCESVDINELRRRLNAA